MCTERKCASLSRSVYHITGANTVAGTAVAIPDPDSDGNVFNALSVINDTDQDIKVTYKTSQGYNGEFIVPKSIKGFTRVLSGGVAYDNTSFVVISLGVGVAAGNISFNLSR